MPSSRTIVLDTHVWIRWSLESGPLSRPALRAIEGAQALVVPTICLWEVALLVDRGRLELDGGPLEWTRRALELPQVVAGPITPEVAVEAAGLRRENFHADPADQLIYATARALDAVLVSADRAMRAFEAARPASAARHLVW